MYVRPPKHHQNMFRSKPTFRKNSQSRSWLVSFNSDYSLLKLYSYQELGQIQIFQVLSPLPHRKRIDCKRSLALKRLPDQGITELHYLGTLVNLL